MTVCLVAIFKNESHILDEWIKHYINQGVDHFFLIDNGSDDHYMDIIQKYNNITLHIDSTRPFQIQHYNTYGLEACKKYDWVILCDLDEFIYARNSFSTLKEYLYSLEDSISQVFIPWKLFGSSGFNTLDQTQPTKVVDHFIKRIYYDKESGFQGVIIEKLNKYSHTKCIVRTNYLIKFDVHSHQTSNRNWIGTNHASDIHNTHLFYKINEDSLSKSCLHLNHYVIQSYDWFMRVKATRLDVNSTSCDEVRGEGYFRSFDSVSNDIDDTELKEINKNLSLSNE